jgi:hypothetical protein
VNGKARDCHRRLSQISQLGFPYAYIYNGHYRRDHPPYVTGMLCEVVRVGKIEERDMNQRTTRGPSKLRRNSMASA